MKKKIYAFITIALLTLAILPIINIQQNIVGVKWKNEDKWQQFHDLYNVDCVLLYINHFFYFFGISTNPSQVVIGKNNWLYLGDQYVNTFTVGRIGTTAQDLLLIKKIDLATKLWGQWFRNKGVRNYKAIIGPDKNTIYPEYLPNWALPDSDSVTNHLLAIDEAGHYVDTISALKAAKTEFNAPLYYETDTHWNSLGAWVAFRAFTKILAAEESLKVLSDKEVHVSEISQGKGMGLANFLRLNDVLYYHEVTVKIDSERPIETEQYDFETNSLRSSGGNPMIKATNHPLLVKSKNALNKKKVLWLRDSFGIAMSPFMAATFTETLQLHYASADPVLLAKLVEIYRPDYVFITVVERDSRSDSFMALPPLIFNNRKGFTGQSIGSQAMVNSLTKTGEYYKISGADPFFVFDLSSPVITKDSSKLFFELGGCEGKNETVNIQVFWRTLSTTFNEVNSLKLTVRPGIIGVDLSPIPAYIESNAISSVRIDFNSPNICSAIAINNIEFGK